MSKKIMNVIVSTSVLISPVMASDEVVQRETTPLDVTQLPTLEVQGQGEAVQFNDVDIAPSASTLDTEASQIELNILELKGVAGTQGDPLAAVKTLPGVVTALGGGGRTPGFYVRGSRPNDNAIYVDDMPVGYIYHFSGLFSVLNADLIDNFSTYLGGFGVEYVDRLGGVVDVQTRQPNDKALKQSYQIGFYDSSARIEGPITDKSAAYFAVRRSYIDLLLPATGELSPDSDNTYTQFPQFWDMQAKYQHRIKDGFVDISYFAANDQAKFNFQDEEQALRDPALLGELGADTSFNTLGSRWYQQLSPHVMQKVRFGILNTRTDFVIGTQQSYDPNPGESYGYELTGKNTFFWPRWEVSQGTNQWTLGLDLNHYDYHLDGYIVAPCREGEPDCNVTESKAYTLDQHFTGSSADAYVEVARDLTDTLFMKAGLRSTNMDYAANPYNEISPRLSLEYSVDDDTLLTGTWGRYVQAPEGSEISDDLGNPELTITEAEHRIVGIKREWDENWSTQLEIYEKPMTKLVVSRPDPERYANDGKGKAQGVDVLIKRKMNEGQYGWLSYSYLESSRQDTGEDSDRLFDGDVPHTLNMVWSQPFRGSWSAWTWGVNLQLQSGAPYTEVVGREYVSVPFENNTCDSNTSSTGCYWNPIYGKTNGKRLPFSTRLDLSMEKTIKYQNWDLLMRFEVLNASSILYPDGNIVGYEYEADYSDYNNPSKVAGFPFLPSFSIRATF